MISGPPTSVANDAVKPDNRLLATLKAHTQDHLAKRFDHDALLVTVAALETAGYLLVEVV
jgi:hypothetical protein